MAQSSSANLARGIVRKYPFKHGRPELRRLFVKTLPEEATIQVNPSLQMTLDLTRKNQKQIFWFYEDIESSLQWTIAHLLPNEGRMVDCGANAGIMGFLALSSRKAQVEFLEPMPRLADSIRTNLQLNGLESKATVHQLAASDQDGEATFHIHLKDGSHSLVVEKDAVDTFTVETKKLQTLLDFSQAIELIKIDTEGNDYQVLIGLGDQLDPTKIKRIYCEMGGRREESHQLLIERGYQPYRALNPKRSIPFQRWKGKKPPQFFEATSTPARDCLWLPKDSPEEEQMLHADSASSG